MMGKVKTLKLLEAVTSLVTSEVVRPVSKDRTFQASGKVSASTGAATVQIQGSNDGVNFVILDTLSLTLGTVTTSDGYESSAPWVYVRAVVATISGTNAEVTVTVGSQW